MSAEPIAAPRRIVCLSDESVETLYLLGEQHRIVGISGFTRRPARARREKPKVAGFASARIERILALSPDLVLGFSDVQAQLAAQLIGAGAAVHVFNQRSIAGILESIALLARLVDAGARGAALIAELQAGIAATRVAAAALPCRPRVYFEEWPEPLISGIGWVGELIEVCGGEDCFAELSRAPAARERVIADPLEVVRRAPDVIIGSWCGRRFEPQAVANRPGWQGLPAVRAGRLHEIASSEILQPGPAALTDGLRCLQRIIAATAAELAREREGASSNPDPISHPPAPLDR